ncbi:hypothetical protein NNJEOMEG_00461 [Fundidesulfovibrio magnetotacticus]|uniref:Vitamin B12 dependent methionine synthase n=1 Tax=Fundidesulfovibrio magnetotacticus TaxID=2730080 RepID=A0A6V8LS72_9BACT|nr:hypothetical protein [Fundidesulfovibrio magnetotacticus]GFK92636.1 hypothetical protein NNJEOMEG_00461 [Fundidesulfovibrio magnetotacticus]
MQDSLFPRLLRHLRLKPDTPAAAEALPLWDEALALARPTTWREQLPIGDFLREFAPHAAQSRDLARTLVGCTSVVLLAATLGEGVERRAGERFASGRPFAGYVLDRMGSFLVEQAMKELHAGVRSGQATRGGRATRRYSPGYGDFPLEAQAHFLRLAGPALQGLGLTAGFALVPAKTVTAVCGLAD